MSDDLIKRLKLLAGNWSVNLGKSALEAADLIEQQAAKIAVLEAAEKEAAGQKSSDGRTIDKSMVKRLAIQHGLIPDAAPASKDAIRREALEEVAIQWDGCFYEGVGERIDIGAAIRTASSAMTPLTSDSDAAVGRVQALFQPWPEGELGPTDEPESQYRLGYNTAIEDALEILEARAQSTNGEQS